MTVSPVTKAWIKGILAAAISGLGTCLAGLLIDISFKKILQLAAFHMLMVIGAYLQDNPLPGTKAPVPVKPIDPHA